MLLHSIYILWAYTMPGPIPTTEVLHNSDSDDDDHKKTLDPARATDIEEVLKLIQQKKWTLGPFLEDLFTTPKMKQKDGNPQTQTQMVSIFLQGRSKVKAQDVASEILPDRENRMYTSRYSVPKAVRNSQNRPASEAKRSDKTKMANAGNKIKADFPSPVAVMQTTSVPLRMHAESYS